MSRIAYDIVVVTKNRPQALRLSLPHMISQSLRPNNIFIVDSSDDPDAVQSEVNYIAQQFPNIHFVTGQRNLAEQRNYGLELVKSPIVIMPDDDSLLFPDAASEILRIYERDKDCAIAGVCAAPSSTPPSENGKQSANSGYKMTHSDKVRNRLERFRRPIDERLFPDPFWVYGRSCWSESLLPDWLEEENAAPVEYMGGFRMSFRTDVVRQAGGFDVDLARWTVWPSCEDADVSFNVARNGLLVGARSARVFHHRFPSGRGPGFLAGFFLTFNRAYIICKYDHTKNSPAKRALKRFAWAKLAYYAAGESLSRRGRGRVRGVYYSLSMLDELLESRPSELRDSYVRIAQQVRERFDER